MISIVMPIYNGIEFIEDSVISIIYQRFKSWELVIGINGHPENSEVYKIAKKYELIDSRIKVLDFPTIKGKSNTLNEMIKYCIYDYVALLDVDDIWTENKLEIQTDLIASNNGLYDVIGSKCIYFGDMNSIVPEIPTGDITKFNFFIVNPIINSSMVMRKELCHWNEKHNGVEDYDLWLKLWKSGKQFYNSSQILVKHRIHKSSAFNAQGNHLNVEELLKKYK